ncbi:hypothetical protein PoB_003879700, partial [Plakobranchus ocellatus]
MWSERRHKTCKSQQYKNKLYPSFNINHWVIVSANGYIPTKVLRLQCLTVSLSVQEWRGALCAVRCAAVGTHISKIEVKEIWHTGLEKDIETKISYA